MSLGVKLAYKLKPTEKQLLHWMLPIMLIMIIYLTTWSVRLVWGEVSSEAQADSEAVALLDVVHHAHHDHLPHHLDC